MPLADRTASLEAATADSRAASEAMESEAAEFFAAQAAERAQAPLNRLADAVERAAPATKSPPKETKSAPVETKAAPAETKVADVPKGKVSGPPVLKKPAAAEAPKVDAKVEAPKAEPPPFEDVPRKFAPGHWDKLHAKSDHFEALSVARAAELETLKAELATAKAASANGTPSAEQAERLTALQAERDSLRLQLQAVAGERIFDAESKPRREAAIAQAKQVAGPEHAARIGELLSLNESTYRDNAIEELIATLPPLRAAKLTQAVADLDRLTAERALAAQSGNELFQRRISEAQAAQERQAAEHASRASATFDSELKDWESAGVTVEEVAAARSVYTGKDATLQDASRAALWGAVGPRVAAQLNEANARVAELEGELAKLRGAQPGVGASTGGEIAQSDEDDPTTTGYSEHIARSAARAGLRVGSQY